MREVESIIISTLKTVIPLVQSKNNHKAWISSECPACEDTSKRIFRYNAKLKVGKCFGCGFSFKDLSKLIEHIRYYKWLKDKMCMNYYRGFVKSEVSDDSLPF